MKRHLSLVAVLVPDYNQGIAFFRDVLECTLIEDTDMGMGKRWVRVALPGGQTEILLARAVGPQSDLIGQQGGGRVWLFLHTDDFDRDYDKFKSKGLNFLETPRVEAYGKVAQFQDPFGNKWDLLQTSE